MGVDVTKTTSAQVNQTQTYATGECGIQLTIGRVMVEYYFARLRLIVWVYGSHGLAVVAVAVTH